MQALLDNSHWRKALRHRHWQKIFGGISGIFLAVALLALADGLIAQMRAGANQLTLTPGESLAISGPVAIKNPLASDLRSKFVPADAPLTFNLEGFFTGYWFGSGMWRGQVTATPHASPGTWELRISFKGAPAQNFQNYILAVYPDLSAARRASLSAITRWLELNPFFLAAGSAFLGISFGVITYFYGCAYARELGELGLAQVYSGHRNKIWCLAPPSLVPSPGSSRMILDEKGHVVCEARTESYEKGKLCLQLLDEEYAPVHALVCLRHPA